MVTRFDTRPFLDIGGFVNVRLRMDDDKMNGYMYQVRFFDGNIYSNCRHDQTIRYWVGRPLVPNVL